MLSFFIFYFEENTSEIILEREFRKKMLKKKFVNKNFTS